MTNDFHANNVSVIYFATPDTTDDPIHLHKTLKENLILKHPFSLPTKTRAVSLTRI